MRFMLKHDVKFPPTQRCIPCSGRGTIMLRRTKSVKCPHCFGAGYVFLPLKK